MPSIERENLISLPETFPLNTIFMSFPPKFRTTTKDTSSPLVFPSVISTGPPRPPSMVPVSLAPSTLNTKVVSLVLPPRPGTCAVHFPVTSAAEAANAKMPRRAVNSNVLMQAKMVLAGAKVTAKRLLLKALFHQKRDQVDHAAGVAPFVVVPGHHLQQVAVQHLGQLPVHNGTVGVMQHVGRDHSIFVVGQNALQ